MAEPRKGRSRLQYLFQKPLPDTGAVVFCGVSGLHYAEKFEYVGDVFLAKGLVASDVSMPTEVLGRAQSKRATAGLFGRYEERHPAGAQLYRVLEAFGQIPNIKPRASKDSPKVL